MLKLYFVEQRVSLLRYTIFCQRLDEQSSGEENEPVTSLYSKNQVFFDINIGPVAQGRIKIELFQDVVPR